MKNIKKTLAIVLSLILIVSVFSACSIKITPEQKLMGSWRDSTGSMGYEFKENNACVITFLDITVPIVNLPYNGSVNGTYQVTKREDGNYYVQITYTVFAASITRDYMFTIDGNALTLTDVKDGSVTVYMAYEAPQGETVGTSAAQ